ncbi:MAG: Cof-type HAD-IIB family hydrolase [bacterium]
MPYRLLALDLDNTLLNAQGEISPGNRRAIQAAQAKGVAVTLATGRMYRSARVFAQDLGVVIPLITYNGALIKDNAGHIYLDRPVPLSAAAMALQVAREHDIHVNLFVRDELYTDREDDWTERYRRFSRVEPHLVRRLEDYLTEPPNKVLFMGHPEEISRVRPVLAERLGDSARLTTSSPRFIEIIHPQVSKRSGLEYLLDTLGIRAEEMVVVGDNYNDLEMIDLAGLGVVVANAPPEVQARADYITARNTEDGVAQVIEKFIL